MTSAIEHAQEMGAVKRARPTYGYYRQPNGWITVSVVTDLEELKYRREGWEPLHQYGRFEMSGEYAADHPLDALFMGGGAHELCLEQIIDQGLHLNLPLVPSCHTPLTQYHPHHTARCMANAKPVHFPQLDNLEIEGFQIEGYDCRFCDRPSFPTEKARDQHEGVMHKDEKSDIRTGQTLADALVKGLTQAQAQPTEEWTPDPGKPYACGFCAEAFASLPQLGRHVKEHKAGDDGEQEA